MTDSGFLLPDLDDETSAPFWAGTARGELLVQRCASCGHLRMPPRPMCPHCRSLEVAWEPMSGRATVWSFAVPHPPLLPAYQELAPYNVVVVALEEDPTIRFVGNLVTAADAPINSVDPTGIQIGEPVSVVFAEVDDVHLPRWVRTEQAPGRGAPSVAGGDRTSGSGRRVSPDREFSGAERPRSGGGV